MTQKPKGTIEGGGKPLPTFIGFAVLFLEKKWHAVAMKIKGSNVVDKRLLESSEWKEAAIDKAEIALKEHAFFELDPFEGEDEG